MVDAQLLGALKLRVGFSVSHSVSVFDLPTLCPGLLEWSKLEVPQAVVPRFGDAEPQVPPETR